MPVISTADIKSLWTQFKGTLDTEYDQHAIRFQQQQPILSQYLRMSDEQQFGTASVIFGYGVFVWLLMTRHHKEIRAVTNEQFQEIIRADQERSSALEDESEFEKENEARRHLGSFPQPFILAFLTGEFSDGVDASYAMTPTNSKLAVFALELAVRALANNATP